jgi:PAS domain S-box-containing protein
VVSTDREALLPRDLGIGRLFDMVRDAVIAAEASSGRIVLWNGAATAIFGYSADEALGMPIEALVPERLRVAHRAGLAQYAASGTGKYIEASTVLELPALHKSGDELTVEMTLSPIEEPSQEGRFALAIIRDVSDRKRAEAEIRSLKHALELRVVERTAELAAANKELEAFCYSVSHDLRAPLRSIDGFSQALLDDHADRLDAEGQDCLRRVRSASQRMSRLIDALLGLSQVTRSEMRREPVDLSRLARAVAADLARTQPDRQVEWHVAEGLVANGDAPLVRLLLENLLGNAWKFTSKNPRARIELGATEYDGAPAFFVRDDGAGFDMAYADRLFGPFQRLHEATEFEGTGIGLATVRRIVHRHGGRVWAESAVEQGATFYFTLPRAEDNRHG